LGCRNKKWFDDTTIESPQFCFWTVHVISAIVLFILGMRFAIRRAPIPFVAYRLLSRIMHK